MLEKNRMKLLKLKRISKRREFIEVPHLYPYKKKTVEFQIQKDQELLK